MRKAQIFLSDVLIAFFVLILSISLFQIFITQRYASIKQSYNCFESQRALIDASELLISTSSEDNGIGLAVKMANNVKHHQLSKKSIEMLKKHDDLGRELALPRHWGLFIYEINGRELFSAGKKEGLALRRFALCGNKECVVELWGKCE
ncbi:hypothetical protein DRN74_01840 [Candidatus Micrarchaeota archaeon]|nr:MAG: hypothetical protein DRN74_01840 [Candidatus Micrarchaeota archaeon]